MSASLLLGKDCAKNRMYALQKKINARIDQGQSRPELAVILLGNNPASTIYVNNKRKACEQAGIVSRAYDLPAETSEDALIHLIKQLNDTAEISGILVQLPLPEHIDTNNIIESIDPRKDVDGFHPYNLGRLAQKNPLLRPCTPLGIINLLRYYQRPIARKNTVIIGASNIVGKPMALEFLLNDATVTICNRSTKNLQPFVELAEILVVATGVIDVIDTAWLKPNQILIDVGMHRLSDGSLRGDVDFTKAEKKVAWISPVPGGVGPMTIISLLENTLLASTLIS
jgi:methylenetetrahydrofolate dehydrogenase (NADP+)/methenyltetrahydrofolate cyclohydrolase